jgi:hypothetical protein
MFSLLVIYFTLIFILALYKRSKLLETRKNNNFNSNNRENIQQEFVKPVIHHQEVIQNNYTEYIEYIETPISYEIDHHPILITERHPVYIFNID